MNGTVVNEIDFKALKQLSQKRDELKAVEKKYFDFESPKEYLKANKTMKEKYKQIMHKMAFLEMLSLKIGVKRTTLQNYFLENGTIPPMHEEIISKAIDLQLEADIKIKAIEVEVFEGL